MFCIKCGGQIPDDVKFCSRCGAPTVKAPSPSRAAAPGGFRSDPSTAPASSATRGISASSSPQVSPAPKPSKRVPSRNVAIGLIAAVLVAMTGTLVFFVGPRVGVMPEGAQDASTSAEEASGAHDALADTAPEEALEQFDFVISQIDNSSFPEVTLYAQLLAEDGSPAAGLTGENMRIVEVGADGTERAATVTQLAAFAKGDPMSINLVVDQSGSMDAMGKMDGAKDAALGFVDELLAIGGAQAEVTAFDDTVSNRQPFTESKELLASAINALEPGGETALNDALYWALQRTNLKSGARMVIAFTDGAENASYYSAEDVAELSRMTGIPVYIIGIGDDVEYGLLDDLAQLCHGGYYEVNERDVAVSLRAIYDAIYQDQLSMLRVVFTSQCQDATDVYRSVRATYGTEDTIQAETTFEYVPVDTVDSFSTQAHTDDYILADSASRVYSESELEQMSLWELYLARNEIFARHGRGFKNQDLVEHFATRTWYSEQYTPEEFDALPNQFNKIELENIETMHAIEMAHNSPYLVTAK